MLDLPIRLYRILRQHGLRQTYRALSQRAALLSLVLRAPQGSLSAASAILRDDDPARYAGDVPTLDLAALLDAAQPAGNVEANRALWDAYADYWLARRRMLSAAGAAAESRAAVLGDEWGSQDEVRGVLERYLFPHLGRQDRVAEIGVGGGRVAALVAPRVGELIGLDVAPAMLDVARERLRGCFNVRLELVAQSDLPADLDGTLDAAYALDVLPYLDSVESRKYLAAIARALRPGGMALLHAASLATDAGWADFARLERESLEGGRFVTPALVRILAERAGLVVEQESLGSPAEPGRNRYLEREYLVLLRKP